MKKKLLIIIGFLGIFSLTYGQYDQKALDILDAMSDKYKNMPSFYASFSYTLENEMENIHEEFSGDIIVKGDKFKLDLGEQEVFNDGETMWTYPVSYTHLTLPTNRVACRSRWSPYH